MLVAELIKALSFPLPYLSLYVPPFLLHVAGLRSLPSALAVFPFLALPLPIP